jgi:hypothetical protein
MPAVSSGASKPLSTVFGRQLPHGPQMDVESRGGQVLGFELGAVALDSSLVQPRSARSLIPGQEAGQGQIVAAAGVR